MSAYVLSEAERAAIRAVADTIHTMANQGYRHTLLDHEPAAEARDERERDDMHRLADLVAAGDTDNWPCCPICEEQTCDGGCPLESIRAASEAVYIAEEQAGPYCQDEARYCRLDHAPYEEGLTAACIRCGRRFVAKRGITRLSWIPEDEVTP